MVVVNGYNGLVDVILILSLVVSDNIVIIYIGKDSIRSEVKNFII